MRSPPPATRPPAAFRTWYGSSSALAADHVAPRADAAALVSAAAPDTVAHATSLRLSRLSPAAGDVAQAIAILGIHARADRVAALAGVDEDQVRASGDALTAVGILDAGARLAFAHPLVHRAIYEDLPQGKRAIAHGHAARLLTEEGAALGEIAAHLLRVDPAGHADVAEQLLAAAVEARARGAPASVVAYLRRAVEEGAPSPSRSELLSELGRAEAVVADERAADHLEESFELADDPVARARTAFDLSQLSWVIGDITAGAGWLDTALVELGDRDLDLAARFEATRAISETFDPRFADAFERRLPRLRELLDVSGPGARHLAIRMATAMSGRWTDHSEVRPLIERGLDGDRFLRDEGPESMAFVHGVAALMFLDEVDWAEAATAGAIDEARRRGSTLGYAVGSWYRGWVSVQRGLLKPAEADYRVALEVASQNGLMFAVPTFLFFNVDILLERPELHDVAQLAELDELASAFGGTATAAFVLVARGRLRLLSNQHEAAVADMRAGGAILEATRLRNPIGYLWRSPLALALPPEDAAEARELVDAELDVARAMGLARAEGVALRALGLLQGGARGLELLAESLAVLEGCASALERARGLVELGAAMRRGDQRVAARNPLRAGLELAQRCGAERLEARAFEELRVSGARPRRRVVMGPDALTPGELRVARMAADGLTNREIAQELFVTNKTVENQLSAVYRKLQVEARDQLADALHDPASTP